MPDTWKYGYFSMETMREHALKCGPVVGELERYMVSVIHPYVDP